MLRSILARGTVNLHTIRVTMVGRLLVLTIELAWARIGPEKMSPNPDGGFTMTSFL